MVFFLCYCSFFMTPQILRKLSYLSYLSYSKIFLFLLKIELFFLGGGIVLLQ